MSIHFSPVPLPPFALRFNFWGYSTVNYFSPMTRYAAAGSSACGREAVNEFKDFVKACHRNGIEVRDGGCGGERK